MTMELGAEARALIDQACNEEVVPSSWELERIRKNVVSGAAATAVVLAAPHAAGLATGTTPLALLGLALKGAALGTVVAVGGYSLDRFVIHPAPAREATHVHDERPAGAAARGPGAGEAPLGERTNVSMEEPAPENPPARPPSPTAKARDGAMNPGDVTSMPSGAATSEGSLEASADLHEETALLSRVQQELRAGRGTEALRLLDASSLRLERGQLRQERLAAEVLAACQTGDLERARRSARAFVGEDPATPSAARLRSSCVGSEFFSK